MTRFYALSFTALLSSLGCAGDLDDELGGDAVEPPAEGEVGPDVHSQAREGGGQLTHVDATDEEAWVYFDLETGTQLQVEDPRTNLDWDLAFQRFHVATNGGISGTAGSEVAIVEAEFDTVTQAPADGFAEDAADGDDDNEDPDYVFADWYDYNPMTHVLTPKPITYVVVTGGGNAFKVALQAYYDDAGTSGFPSFAWEAL